MPRYQPFGKTLYMTRLNFLIFLILISGHVANAQQERVKNSLTKNEIQWIQKTLDNWDSACRMELKIRTTSLPWIIFYDSVAAWHINPNERMLPSFEKTNYRFLFDRKYYQLIKNQLELGV